MKTVVYLLPHQDDEIFALPIILSHRDCEHIFIVLTSGAGKNESTKNFTRDSEFRSSLAILEEYGVRSQFFPFGTEHSIRDGLLHADFSRDAYQHLLEQLQSFEPEIIVAPCYEGGHQDHDASARIAEGYSKVFGSDVLFFSTYRSAGSSFPFFSTMKPFIPSERILFSRLLVCPLALRLIMNYRSQLRTFAGLGLPILFSYLFKAWYTVMSSQIEFSDPHLYEQRKRAKKPEVAANLKLIQTYFGN